MLNKACVKFLMWNYQKAIEDYTSYIKKYSNHEGSYLERGQCYMYLGLYDKAINDWGASIKIKPEDNPAYLYRACAYKMLKMEREFKKDYDIAIQYYRTDGYFLPNDLNNIIMSTYLNILDEANSHEKMATSCFLKKKFDNKFLLNLVTMSLEKYMVSFLMAKESLPEGHTLSFLANEVIRYIELSPGDMEMIQTLDEKIQLCSLELVDPYIPADTEMESILNTLHNIRVLVSDEILNTEAA